MRYWLNFFRRTRREYFADFFITPPITVALLALSLSTSFSATWPLKFLAGLVLWTFYEYATHRWVMHAIWPFREAHALHHADQQDYIALHPLVTLGLYAVTAAIFGVNSSAVTVGFSVGYIVYSSYHTAFHYAIIWPTSWLYQPKLRHDIHHRMPKNFGVTTSLWDRIFGTELKKGK